MMVTCIIVNVIMSMEATWDLSRLIVFACVVVSQFPPRGLLLVEGLNPCFMPRVWKYYFIIRKNLRQEI